MGFFIFILLIELSGNGYRFAWLVRCVYVNCLCVAEIVSL